MPIIHNRRRFLGGLSAAGAASLLGPRTPLAAEGPPEVTTLRLRRDPSICVAPWYIAEDLLRAEGFTDIQYVPVPPGTQQKQMIAGGELDFTLLFAGTAVTYLDEGVPMVVLAGLHPGCFELFAHDPIRTIMDLKGKKVGIEALGAGKHIYLAVMASHVGLDPEQDIHWVEAAGRAPAGLFPMDMFIERQVDAFLGYPPEPQELRQRHVGRVILNTTVDKPWSQYFCCVLIGGTGFVNQYPIATKRLLRAVLKANDLCQAAPDRAARHLIARGFSDHYGAALETLSEIPYGAWRDYDPEDALRFFALRLHQVGMISATPNELLEVGTDWRFLDELKQELKM
jgi:NitT/TauT family transport system substrate-binding protein